MADEIAVDSFLDLLRQSDLVSGDQLSALEAEFRGESAPSESSQKLADELVKREILTAWQAEMLMQGKHRGFRLGPYRILRPLGQGGMSKVFLAQHEMMHRCCAIKVLPSKYQEDPDLLSRFHLEARAIAALDHPNIVRAYDFNKDVRYGKEIHYLVMEYVEGPDLRRLVEDQGPLDYRKAADFVCQAAEGLAHAHAAGFVHRDIKPANLLVDPHGVLKVLDLGLATVAFEAEQNLGQVESGQSAVGTADYVAPEQVMDSRTVDGRADVYSLGHTFYFLLTGRRPFTKPTIMEVLMAHRVEKPEPISSFRPDVPLDLDAIIDKMTAKSPHQRYRTAKEVAEKLRKWLAESGSARTYSRISALMAEATRGKQPSTQDTTRAAAAPTETTDLELAPVDGLPVPAPIEAKTPESPTAKPLEVIPLDVKDKPRQPVGKESRLPRAERQPTQQTDALAGLLGEDFMASLPPAAPMPAVPAGQHPLQHAGRLRSKKQSPLAVILKSPWTWVGLAGLLLVVVLLVVVIVVGSSSKQELVGPSGSEVPTPPPSVRPPPPPPKPAPPIPSVKPAEPVEPKPPTTVETPPAAAQPPVQPSVEEAPSTPMPAETPTPAAPPAKPEGETQPAEAAKPPEPAKPPVEETVDKDALLAGLKKISIRVNTPDTDSNSRLNQMIQSSVTEAAKRANNIKVAGNEPAVMEIELRATTVKDKDEDSVRVVMTAELKCPAQDGNLVSAWKKSEQIFSGKMASPQAALNLLRDPVRKFFVQFQRDVHKATRAKAAPK